MAEIKLKRGGVTIIDDGDFELVSQWKWTTNIYGYVVTYIKCKALFMHRLLLKTPREFDTDHINGNILDNRKQNLRLCTKAQNQHNAKVRKDSRTGFKGVRLSGKKFYAEIRCHKKIYYLGVHETPVEAAKAYDAKAIELHGEFARTNKSMGLY